MGVATYSIPGRLTPTMRRISHQSWMIPLGTGIAGSSLLAIAAGRWLRLCKSSQLPRQWLREFRARVSPQRIIVDIASFSISAQWISDLVFVLSFRADGSPISSDPRSVSFFTNEASGYWKVAHHTPTKVEPQGPQTSNIQAPTDQIAWSSHAGSLPQLVGCSLQLDLRMTVGRLANVGG